MTCEQQSKIAEETGVFACAKCTHPDQPCRFPE